MPLRNVPIQRKLTIIILFVACVALLVTGAAYSGVEYLLFRQNSREHLTTLGRVIAANSTAALAFDDESAMREILSALKAEPHVVGAGLYDKSGKLVAKYITNAPPEIIGPKPGDLGFHIEPPYLTGCLPVYQADKFLGTLCLKSDMGAMWERFRLNAPIAALVLAVSVLLAYVLSRILQQQVTRPILALVGATRDVAARRDYSVRVPKTGGDELGTLTDSFNEMLNQIEQGNAERKRTEEAIRESEERFRALVTASSDAIYRMNPDWTEMRQLHGRDFVSNTDEPTTGWLQKYIPPKDQPVVQRAIEDAIRTKSIFSLEHQVLREDGTPGWTLSRAVPRLDAGGEITEWFGAASDITARKEAAQKLQIQLERLALLSRTTRAIGERQDLASIFQVVVRSLEENLPIDFGCVCVYDGVKETLTVASVGLQGQPLAAGMGLEVNAEIEIDANGLARCIRGELVHEPDIRSSSFAFPQRLARTGLASMVISPLLVESQVFGVLVATRRVPHSFTSADCEFLRQLSEHVALAAHQAQLYDALQRAYNDLRQTQQAVMQQERLRALGQMASGIAHDINNAISPVSLYAESLLEHEPGLSQRSREYLETISRAIDDVAATVARMREFYRQREAQLTLAPVNLNELVSQVLNLTHARWSDMPQQRGFVIETSTDLAPNLPAVMGVESEIREALTNLVFNAVDAMPEGGTLTIRTKVVEEAISMGDTPPARHVQLEVVDTGIGMDEDTRRRCLEPFFTTKGERGTGLGLAMVYGIMQRQNGDIEIDSAPGKGTTMRLIFAVPTAVAPGAAGADLLRFTPPRMRILVIDDDPMLLKSLRDILEADGHVVTTAGHGQAGIDTFRETLDRQESFGAVITDLGMPRVDGRMVARAIKSMSPEMPVIMLTGWGRRLQAEGDIPPHVDYVLNKPPKLNELREALVRAANQTAG